MSPEFPGRALREGREVLVVPIGLGRNEFALTKLKALRTSPGFRIGADGPAERFLEGFYKDEGRLFLYGPWEPGLLLEEVLALGLPQALGFLARLAEALTALGDRLPESLATDAVRFLDDGAVELLSPAVMKQVRSLRPETLRRRTFEQVNHPDLKKPGDRLSYFLAALLYRLIAGEYPYAADTEEEVRRRTRELRPTPLTLARPDVKPEVEAAVLAGLGRGQGAAPSTAQWGELLCRSEKDGLFRDLPEADRQALAAQAARARATASRAYRRGVFWQRHWKTVLIAVAAAAAVGVFSGTILKNLLKPRSTRGYSPLQVVETFYRSVNTLDHERMQDCVTGRAGKPLLDQVINVYVISRVNLGYEGRSLIRSAEEWDKAGRPPVTPPESVFGITDLAITAEGGEPQPVFRAAYRLWTPSAETGTEARPIAERLQLKLLRGVWVIERIQPAAGPE